MLSNRDQSILEHIGLYRVSIRRAISKACMGGRDCGSVIHDLCERGFLSKAQVLAQRRTCYRLTRKATEYLGLPESVAREDAGQALHINLAILWHCVLTELPPGEERRRLSQVELESFFPERTPDAPHTINAIDGRHRIMRIYVPGAGTKTKAIKGWVRQVLESSAAHPALHEWQERRQYGFAILVHTEGRRARLSKLLRSGGEAGNLNADPQAEAGFSVHCVPDLITDRLS